MDFTFGICTFNSAEFIIETLESIRFQVETYGENNSVYLLIADDASTDNTVSLVKEWVKKYAELFVDTNIIESDCNHGIAYNYSQLMKQIKTDYFKTIDGDDVFSSFNIFKQFEGHNKNEMPVYFPIRFNKEGTFVNESDCSNMFYYNRKNHSHKKDLHLLESIKPFITPEVCFDRKLFDEEVYNFVTSFTQFEDDTTLYYIFKSNDNMQLKFFLEPMILYRIHDKSLSNGSQNPHQIKFLDDLHRFKTYVFKNEKNLYYKKVLFWAIFDTFRMKHRFGFGKSPYRRYVSKKSNIREKWCIANSDYSEYCDKIEKYKVEEAQHLEMMKKRAEEFITMA